VRQAAHFCDTLSLPLPAKLVVLRVLRMPLCNWLPFLRQLVAILSREETMQRYLVIDANCSLCTELARSTCNETKNWIDGVVSLRDSKTRQMLSAGGHPDLWQPALIETENNKTRVYAGLRLRWQLLLNLGPRRTWRLGRTLASAIVKAPGLEKQRQEVAHGESRRRFVGALAKAATMLGVLTGLGFPKKAFALPGRSGSYSPDHPFAGWLAQLQPGKATEATPHELQGLWAEYRSSSSMRTLLASAHLHADSDVASVRRAVSEVTPPTDFKAVRHAVEDGRTLDAIGLQRGSLMLLYYSLKAPGTLAPTKTRLLLLTVVDGKESRRRVRVLAKIEDGTPTLLIPASANVESCSLEACQQAHGPCFMCMCTDWDYDWNCILANCTACLWLCATGAEGFCALCLFTTCPWLASTCDNVCVAEGCGYSAGLCMPA
jgi:hypothetical protein